MIKHPFIWLCFFAFFMACKGNGTPENENQIISKAPHFTKKSSYTNSVILNWEEFSQADRYEIRVSESNDMSQSRIFSADKLSIEVEDLERERSYFFQVRAKLKSGWSEWSHVKNINTASFDASVTTYNVLSVEADPMVEPEFAWQLRKDALMAMILQANNDADIIGFQETTIVAEEIKEMIGETYDSHISGREVSARLISWKPEKFELVEYDDDIDIFGEEVTGRYSARFIGHVKLREIKTGKELLLYNIHVPASTNLPRKDGQEIREVGARNLAKYAKQKTLETGLPAIVLGDFNNYFATVIEGIQSAPMTLSKAGFVDTFQSAKTRRNEDYSTTVNRANSSVKLGENGTKRLDYIFTYPKDRVFVSDFEILINFKNGSNTELQKPVPSDHHPVRSHLYFTYY